MNGDVSMRFLPTDPLELLGVLFDKLRSLETEINDAPKSTDTDSLLSYWDKTYEDAYEEFVLKPWVRKHRNLEWLFTVRSSANRTFKEIVSSAQAFGQATNDEFPAESIETLALDAYEIIQRLDEALSKVDKRTLAMYRHFTLATTVNSPDRYSLTERKDFCIERGGLADFENYLEAGSKNLRMMRSTLSVAGPVGVTVAELESALDRLEVAILEEELVED